MKKICLILCCVLIVSLTGCGSDMYSEAIKPDDMSDEVFNTIIKTIRIVDDRLSGKTTAQGYEDAIIELNKNSKESLKWIRSSKYEDIFSFSGNVLFLDDDKILHVNKDMIEETIDGRNKLAEAFSIPAIKLEDTHCYKILQEALNK